MQIQIIFPPIENVVVNRKMITILIFYNVTSRLVAHLSSISYSVQVPKSPIISLSCKFSSFVFHKFIPEMSAGFTLYIVRINPFYLGSIM
jgi:hypothetical protein